MSTYASHLALIRTLLASARMLRLSPQLNSFFLRYLKKFQLRDIGGQLIVHSHLPALNSRAYARFIDQHLLAKTSGPSHAQISLTNVCPQNCAYCYNKQRSGVLLSTEEILRLIQELKQMGVFWLGFTGGEPLLNPDLVTIVRSVGEEMALKLFTTGEGLDKGLAQELKRTGLDYVSVSLDHWDEESHDRVRGRAGAYQVALQAIRLFLEAGLHVSVSAVVSREMLQQNQVETLLQFLIDQGVHEAWLSEAKPVDRTFWNRDFAITEAERQSLIHLQDRYNRERAITVNYLGHFEDRMHFGCNAGGKMIYIDAFGEVSPCVFVPMSFGNVRQEELHVIHDRMRGCFAPSCECFINRHCETLNEYYRGQVPLGKEDSMRLLNQVAFASHPEFDRLHRSSETRRGGS